MIKNKEKSFKARDIAKWELSAEDVKRAKVLLDDKDEAYKGNLIILIIYSNVPKRQGRVEHFKGYLLFLYKSVLQRD